MDEEVSTDKAIKIFMELDQKSESRSFKPPKVEFAGLSASRRRLDELPSVKIDRLKNELDEL